MTENNTTRFKYNRNNRLVKETKTMGEQTAYDYDGVGNLIEKLDAKNQKTSYTYDDAGRLATVRYYNASGPLVKAVSFTYDKVGNLKSYNDGITSASYGYDNNYRKTLETLNVGNFELSYSYTYYGNGMKKSFTGPDNVTYTYTYDVGNQLTGVQIPGAGSITYSSYTWNRPASITLPGGSKKDYVYDPLMRIKEITAKDPAQNVLMNYQYNYDKMDNIKTKGTEHGNYQYSYDDLYRLTSADNPVQNDEAYTYDNVGNRLTSASTTAPWQYNVNNELQSYNGTSYQYDANGNTIKKTTGTNVTNYIYNTEDRLTEVRDGSNTVIATYYYDPFGRRLWKEVNGQKTYFLYSDEGLIGEYDTSGSEIKTYGFRPDSTWTTNPLFIKENGNYYFYQNDHLGTPQKLTTTSGAVVWSATYSSFGNAAIETEAVKNNLRFPGQYFDQETGFHYNYHRYYDPATGRYMRTDPIGLIGGINLYIYCISKPINSIDPHGLEEKCIPWFAEKTEWREFWSKEKWEFAGSQVIMTGVSGVCFWRKYKLGEKAREVTPRKICWDSCKPEKLYIKKEKTFIQTKSFKVLIDTDMTPIKWTLPVGGFAWIYECDRNYRSPFFPYKE